MLTLIDRYIAKLFLKFFCGGLVVFVTLFLTVDFMSGWVRYDAAAGILIRYYLLAIPNVVYQMIPVASLLATVFTLSALSKTNELVALFSSGMSLARISMPILVLVLLISAFSFLINDRLMPSINQRKNYVLYVEIRNQPGLYSTVKTNRIWYRSGNVLYNIKTLQAERGTAQGLTMYFFDGSWELIQMITAKQVDLKGDTWQLVDGTVTLFSEKTSLPMTRNFKSKSITVSEDTRDIQQSSQSTDSLSLAELKRFITRNKEAGLDTLRYEVDYFSKFSFACAAFVMSFLAIPFSVGRQRSSGNAMNVGITILLAFLYWASYSSGVNLGKHGALPPALAVSLPNVIMLILSGFFLLRLKR